MSSLSYHSDIDAIKGGGNFAVFAADKSDLTALPASFVLKYSIREEYINLL